MINKLPILYYKPGKIVDVLNENWFEADIFTINDLKKEIAGLKPKELFHFLIKITSNGLVNFDVITEVVGFFEEPSNLVVHCKSPFNENILHCTLGYTIKKDFKQIHSLNFYFKNRIPIFDEIKSDLKVENRLIDSQLRLLIAYPVFDEEGINYTNQLLLKYNFIEPDVSARDTVARS